jgi:hypothetical protein
MQAQTKKDETKNGSLMTTIKLPKPKQHPKNLFNCTGDRDVLYGF